MTVQTKVLKWGNSLGIRLKKVIADQLKLRDGTSVNVSVIGKKIVLEPVTPAYKLQDLVGRINENNIHRETDTSPAIGAEIW